MHEQRLAATRGHPEGQLVEVVGAKGGKSDGAFACSVLLGYERVEVGEEGLRFVAGAVQVVLGHERCKDLEVLEHDGLRTAPIEGLGVTLDAGVIGQEPLRLNAAHPPL